MAQAPDTPEKPRKEENEGIDHWGMGTIGAMVSKRFVQEGHRPIIIARHLDRSLIGLIEDKVDIVLADLLDLPRIISIIQSYNITHIIHAAALLGALSLKNPPHSVHITFDYV